MPRKPRIEIGGGLYHVITRVNSRRKILRRFRFLAPWRDGLEPKPGASNVNKVKPVILLLGAS